MRLPIDANTRVMMTLAVPGAEEALLRFQLFDRDVEGAAESLRLVVELTSARPPIPKESARAIHHASCFVCAVRRVGRLLESLVRERTCFRDSVADVIRLEWKKKRAFFESYVDARNAIEHIDTEVSEMTQWTFYSLVDDKLAVTGDHFVDVNQAALDKLCSARDNIATAIVAEYPNPFPFED